MEDRKYYVLCDANCKFESMTKEQILTAISQAVATGSVGDCDTGFIQTIKTINGQPLRFFVGTQSEYELLSASNRSNLFAIITNDTTKDGILNAIEELQTATEELQTASEEHAAQISRVISEPAIRAVNTDAGGITKSGYYYIDVRSKDNHIFRYSIGLIYWETGIWVRKIFGFKSTQYTFLMTNEGDITLLEGNTDVTDNFDIFVNQWGE